ncbi:hypothetical protein CCACVL1_07880 [Corchorus capsularis]|uniref:Uncharacterized protein n=1 Tax=Corchorus capsularis TaxID=210143 RepID=A0A1R3J3F7_COCAP|nr:hypothetical protein CCACVL1_07880 [Corchorus capsularis]
MTRGNRVIVVGVDLELQLISSRSPRRGAGYVVGRVVKKHAKMPGYEHHPH